MGNRVGVQTQILHHKERGGDGKNGRKERPYLSMKEQKESTRGLGKKERKTRVQKMRGTTGKRKEETTLDEKERSIKLEWQGRKRFRSQGG